MLILFWISFACILYTLAVYPFILISIDKLLYKNNSETKVSLDAPSISCSVIIAAYNEAETIHERLCNLVSSNRRPDEIIVCSDGSTDKTASISAAVHGVRVIESKTPKGRALMHNEGVSHAKNDIVIFTDAETIFQKECITELLKPFADDRVGCTIGKLIYQKSEDSPVFDSESTYWNLESRLRLAESNIGVLATGTGACMAVRKAIWKQLSPSDDVDFITPLDGIIQNYRNVFVTTAIATDEPPSTLQQEYFSRIRQTSKNLAGTLNRWNIRQYFTHPIISFCLVSHKIFRWFIGYFLLLTFISSAFLAKDIGFFFYFFLFEITLSLLAIVGLKETRFTPLLKHITHFFVAVIAMTIGCTLGLLGQAPNVYRRRND